MSELYDILVETPPTKVILLALDQGLWDCERSLAELSALCEANHMEAVAQVTQKRQTPETGIVLGSGKLEEASLAAETLGAECAVFDGELTGSQIRNISNALGGLEVIDRTMLILEIFRSRAVTNEGKLQTELALLRYRLPRLQGMGEALSRQGGGGGGGGGARRGAGETKLELDRRHVHARIDALAEKLAEMEKRRGESRKARAKTGMPVVSLVGYTNVGKSSLMNALCGPSVAEADMLFATLDPTSRKLILPSGMAVLLVDTVGFVSRLPHNLVEAFKSTLEEAAWSDVIIRVADAGDEQREEQLAVTDEVLDGLDCADIPRLTVYNKCDKPGAMSFDPDILLTSAKTGYGLDTLLAKLDEMLSDRVHTLKVLLPYDKLGLAAPMRERGSVQVEEYREDGLYLEGIVKTEDLHCFEISHFDGSRLSQFASFPLLSKENFDLESIFVFAFSSALRIFADFSAQAMIAFKVSRFRSKNLSSSSPVMVNTAFVASALASFVFVCPSKIGSGCFTATTAVMPFLVSAPVKLLSFSFKMPSSLA